MNAETKVKAKTAGEVLQDIDGRHAGLAKLREKFPPKAISKLPKPTKAQTDAVRADFKKGIRCKECGSWHHPDVVHLDYVGHAALTDRLLDVDPEWTWEPMGRTPEGLPITNGGLWIKLTVCGVSRYGFGAADGKSGGDAVKEMIGDALRNAAMRFGAALDLWHKGELPSADDEEERQTPRHDPPVSDPQFITEQQRDEIARLAEKAGVEVKKICDGYGIESLLQLHADSFDKCAAKLRKLADERQPAPAGDIIDDDIPY